MKDTDVLEFKSLVEKNKSGSAVLETKEVQALFVKSINAKKRQITACASANTLDRDGEIILPSAFRKWLPVYMKNPIVIVSHQHRLETGHSPVVANVIDARIDTKGLWVIIEFIQGTALGEEYWLLYSTKKQRALSVGVMPRKWEYGKREGQPTKIFTEVELLEITLCPVPSCREALSRSKQKKAEFVAAKKEEKEEEKILAEIRAADPDFDLKCSEFAKALLGRESEVPEDGCDDFSKIVSGGIPKIDFAALIAR